MQREWTWRRLAEKRDPKAQLRARRDRRRSAEPRHRETPPAPIAEPAPIAATNDAPEAPLDHDMLVKILETNREIKQLLQALARDIFRTEDQEA